MFDDDQQRGEDERFMRLAIVEAEKARRLGEIPIGAVVVVGGEVVGRGHNRREGNSDPTGHAEMFAVRRAARKLGSWRLIGATLYVTLEPCVMCIGATINARVPRLVYGPRDPKAGAVDSLYDIARDPRLNHRVSVTSGVLEEELSQMLSGFFAELRHGRRSESSLKSNG